MEVYMLYNLVKEYDMVQVKGQWSITSIADVETAFNAEGITLNLKDCSVDTEYSISTGDSVLVYWLDARTKSVWFRCDLMDAQEYAEAYEEESEFEEE